MTKREQRNGQVRRGPVTRLRKVSESDRQSLLSCPTSQSPGGLDRQFPRPPQTLQRGR